MIRLTRTAALQIDDLFGHFMKERRDEAIRNLDRAVREALTLIEVHPERGLVHPRPYPSIARWGLSLDQSPPLLVRLLARGRRDAGRSLKVGYNPAC